MLPLSLCALLLLIAPAMGTATEIPSNTSVVAMLQVIPQCAVPCVMHDVFEEGGCPLTTAGPLAQCACVNITMQSRLSTCVQQSCAFRDQVNMTAFASGLCKAYPKRTRSYELKTTAIITIILSTPLLFLRIYSRWFHSGRLWSDDAFAIIAAIALVAVSGLILKMSLLGFGLHYWDIPAENGVKLLQMFYACQMLYLVVQVFSKVAILALYARLFPSCVRWFHWTVRFMIVFMFLHGIVFFLLVTCQCLPVRSIWDKTINGRCLPVSNVIIFPGAGLSIVEDLIILFMPIRELWKLQMNTKKKIVLIFLLAVGSFASIASIVRLRYILKYANTWDITWDNVDVLKWSLIEILMACVCGNLMPLRPLVDRLIPNIRSVFSRKSTSPPGSLDKQSQPVQNTWGSPARSPIKSTNMFSSFNLTQLTSRPGQAEGITQEKEGMKNSGKHDVRALQTPTSAHINQPQPRCERDMTGREGISRSDMPYGVARPIPTIILSNSDSKNSFEPEKPHNNTQYPQTRNERTTSRGSEYELIESPTHGQHRHSGLWNLALNAIYRK